MNLDRRRKPPMKSLVVQRSVYVNGHHSSVSLETAFWNALKEIAVAQNISVNGLASKIDRERETANLSSAIRLFVLDHYRLNAEHSHRREG